MKISILNTPYSLSLLPKLGEPNVYQPEISQLIESVYLNMFGYIIDHIMSQRQDNPLGVTKTHLLSSKIGGTIQDRIVFIPDPMCATGHSAEKIINYYLKNYALPKKIVLVHLVITPFYLERIKKIKTTDIHIYAARMDLKLSKYYMTMKNKKSI